MSSRPRPAPCAISRPASSAAISRSRALVVAPYAAGLATPRRRRDGSRRHRPRHGRRHHLDRGLLRRQPGLSPTCPDRRQSRHERHRARPVDDARACRADEDALRQRALSARPTSARRSTVPQIGEDDPDSRSRCRARMLTGIIQPRIEETFELVRDRLRERAVDDCRTARRVDRRRQSDERRARDSPARILGKQVRLGPADRGLRGLAEATGGPAFATGAGLLGLRSSAKRRRPVGPSRIHSDGASNRLDRPDSGQLVQREFLTLSGRNASRQRMPRKRAARTGGGDRPGR